MNSRVRLVLASLLAVLSSCSREPETDAFRVALVTPGTITDDGWNSYAFEGLGRIERELGAVTRHFQTKSPTEFESTLRGFASDGFDLVIAHGHEYGDAAVKVGALFPETRFLVTSGAVNAANVTSIDFGIDAPARLAGMLAASLTKSKKLGCIGGMEIPPVVGAFDAFRAGAQEIVPDVEVVVSWVGSWEDAAAAYQATRAQIGRGVDVLFHDADAAGFGVFNAAEEAGLLAIGCNKDQNAVKPATVVASVVLEIPKAFLAVASEVKEGRFSGTVRKLGAKEGFVRLALNDALSDKVSEVTRRRIEAERVKLAQ